MENVFLTCAGYVYDCEDNEDSMYIYTTHREYIYIITGFFGPAAVIILIKIVRVTLKSEPKFVKSQPGSAYFLFIFRNASSMSVTIC